MKYLFMGAAAILVLTGCHSDSNYRGRPSRDSYIEGTNDRSIENKSTDNLRDVGRQSSPTAPITSPNGSLNF
jgi:hypothetical protein